MPSVESFEKFIFKKIRENPRLLRRRVDPEDAEHIYYFMKNSYLKRKKNKKHQHEMAVMGGGKLSSVSHKYLIEIFNDKYYSINNINNDKVNLTEDLGSLSSSRLINAPVKLLSVTALIAYLSKEANEAYKKSKYGICANYNDDLRYKCMVLQINKQISLLNSQKRLCRKTSDPESCIQKINDLIENLVEKRERYLGR